MPRRGKRPSPRKEYLVYHLDWNCNSTGALSVTAGVLGIPANRACKVVMAKVVALSDGGGIVRGMSLYNNAGVVAISCPPKILNSQKQQTFTLKMPASEDFGNIPSTFKILQPTPAVGGFRAIVHVHVLFEPQTVYPSLA